MRWSLFAAVLICTPFTSAVGATQAPDLAALEAEYAGEHVEWAEAYAAAREARVRARSRPANPAIEFWPRYLAAFEAGAGPAAVWLVKHARDADLGVRERRAALPQIVERALTEHRGEPWLEAFCLALPERKHDLDADALQGWLDSWLATELAPEVRAAASWLKAESLAWKRDGAALKAAQIRAALQDAHDAAPLSAAGRKAGDDLFVALERRYRAELAHGLPDGPDARSVLVEWRTRFERLASRQVERAEVFLYGATWIAEPAADYARLLELLQVGQDRWNERLEQAQEEGGDSGLTPRMMALFELTAERGFWPAFESLADSDPEAGAWLVEHAAQMPTQDEATRDRLFERLEQLVREHGDADWAPALAASLGGGAAGALGEQRVAELSARWADATANEEVAVQLRYQLAVAELERDRERGLALLREVAERWPDHVLGERAVGRIASLTQLALGQPAPEIVGTDFDGVEFKLSDYRGKVVMLDFWGDW